MSAVWKFPDAYMQRSREVLALGLGSAPAYRTWQARDPGADASLDARYAALPFLTKRDLREQYPLGLVHSDRNLTEALERGEIEWVKTSGTTQESVTNLWHQAWWDAAEAASWKLNAHMAGFDGTQREAVLASALSVGFRSETDLAPAARTLGRLLFLNEYATPRQWTEALYARMARELDEFAPAVLEANPSYLARLAWWALDRGVRLAQPQVIVFTYELPSEVHLREIRRVFTAPLVSSYGSTETGYVCMECERGTLHQNTEFCRVDLQPLPVRHGGPELARLLVTPFRHPWTALIKFDIGDLVRPAASAVCPCGRREGVMLTAVEGRLMDATFTTSGRLVTTREVNLALAAVPGLRDYELTQDDRSTYAVRIVTTGDGQAAATAARIALQAVYRSGAEVRVEPCGEIAPHASGKYRRTRAAFPFSEEELYA